MKKQCDFLVIGSGIAGLSYALKMAEFGTVFIVTKDELENSNTKYAQGGVAVVTHPPDNYEKHIEDTFTAGHHLNNPEIVEIVVKEGPKQVDQLVKWGAKFDVNKEGVLELGREGGHSEFRVRHHKDNTGAEIERALIAEVRKNNNITIFEYHFAVDIITQHHLGKMVTRYDNDIECYGAYVLDIKNKRLDTFLSRSVLMASGGSGNLYQSTTNPTIATGDGIAMVYRAKGLVENLEFVQFHPTALYNPGEKPTFLITEALRGFGAILKTKDGNEFMSKYHSMGSLAPRDIVARAIDQEMKKRGDDCVFLDCRHLDQKELENKFPTVCTKVKSLGINPAVDMIPVVFSAHYQCGGVKVNEHAQTTINRLYAVGEVASTGLHGANRLASNSLLEAVVFANRAAKHTSENCLNNKINTDIPEWVDHGDKYPEELILVTQSFREMQQIMSSYVGIVRSDLRLKRALKRLEIIYEETETLYNKSKLSVQLCELRNLINVGYLLIKMAQRRKESIGLHYNIDHTSK